MNPLVSMVLWIQNGIILFKVFFFLYIGAVGIFVCWSLLFLVRLASDKCRLFALLRLESRIKRIRLYDEVVRTGLGQAVIQVVASDGLRMGYLSGFFYIYLA